MVSGHHVRHLGTIVCYSFVADGRSHSCLDLTLTILTVLVIRRKVRSRSNVVSELARARVDKPDGCLTCLPHECIEGDFPSTSCGQPDLPHTLTRSKSLLPFYCSSDSTYLLSTVGTPIGVIQRMHFTRFERVDRHRGAPASRSR